jgi:hypothetical protein
MTTANMPTLWQNCLLQFSTEIARKAWVWFAETRGSGMQYDADKYASEVETLVLKLRPMLNASRKIHDASDEAMCDILRFILIRHANYRIGNNVKPSFLTVSA